MSFEDVLAEIRQKTKSRLQPKFGKISQNVILQKVLWQLLCLAQSGKSFQPGSAKAIKKASRIVGIANAVLAADILAALAFLAPGFLG